MKKIGILWMLICLIFSFVFVPVGVLAAEEAAQSGEVSAVANSCHGVDADTALLGTEKRVDNLKSAFLYEANSQTLMYALNPDEKLAPASFVKILTVLIAVERGTLSDMVTVTEGAVASVPFDAVSADLLPNEQMSLEDLLYCVLVGSANDAASVVAEHICGSQEAFVQVMNDYARELGCTGTQFTNVHGLHDDAQYTTARDTARILDAALRNEEFRTVFTAVSHDIAATNLSEERNLITGNFLMDKSSRLYYDSRVIGGRTGVAGDGRRTLAAAAEKNGMMLISVVMGAESVYLEDGYSAVSIGGYKETSTLLDAGFNGYKTAQILFADQALKQCTVIDGASDVVVGPNVSVTTVLPENITAGDLAFRFDDDTYYAPIEAGQKLSNVTVWHGNMCIAQVELYALNAVSSLRAQQEYIAPEKVNVWPVVLWVAVGIAVGVVVVFAGLRFVRILRRLAADKRSRRYRRSRRRSR